MKNNVSAINNNQPPAKKHHALLWILGIFGLMIVGVVALLTFFGFMPGLSGLFGTNKAKNLNVSYSQADLASFKQKTGVNFLSSNVAPASSKDPATKTYFSNPKAIDVWLTQQEVTAALNNIGVDKGPIKNIQVSFAGNNIALSGNIDGSVMSQAMDSANSASTNQKSLFSDLGFMKYFGNLPIYLQASVTVNNNQASLKILSAKVGNFGLPVSVANDAIGSSNLKISASDELNIQTAEVTNNQLHFVGTLPTNMYIQPN